MALGWIIAGAISISELGKNISEIVKNFFECVEIGKRIKREETLARPAIYIEENKNKLSVSVSYLVFDITRSVERESLLLHHNPTLIVSKDIINDNNCAMALRSAPKSPFNILDENADDISNLLSKYASDSVVIVNTEHCNTESFLYFYMLNIVPSNDDRCYVLKIKIEHHSVWADVYRQFATVISQVITQTSSVFYRYREPVSNFSDRLELEIRTLGRMGFNNIEINQISDGYGIVLPLANVRKDIVSDIGTMPSSVMIKIPYSYPSTKPLVVLNSINGHTNVDLDVVWNANYTIGHILKALKEGGVEYV